ncbi:DUF7511 domain-containing protein [Haloplanus halobius]|uniref:DUF7511 domain-containing protein n=1 Tax=Haloplanus halobius TaxID=2934938 RepID=UPI00200F9F8D|nr:hypothetical protein [Haloplanus sp. XH21]
MSDSDDTTALRPSSHPPESDTRPLTSVVVERDDNPDSCTLYPVGARDEAPVTRWLSGTGDAFVDLDDAR